MNTIKIICFSIAAAVLCSVGIASAVEQDQSAGARIFLKNKCQSCHTVLNKGIGKPKPKKAAEDDGWGDDDSNKGAPDLSGIGTQREAEWLNLWLDKKVRTEKGKKHMKPFKGSDEDQKVLVDWLTTLKTPISTEEKK